MAARAEGRSGRARARYEAGPGRPGKIKKERRELGQGGRGEPRHRGRSGEPAKSRAPRRGDRRGRHRARGVRRGAQGGGRGRRPLETTEFDLGAAHYLATGEVLSDATLEELGGFEAILLGAVGPPVGDTSVPPGTLERGLLLRLRFELDLYVNLRPFTGVPGSIAEGADFVVSGRTPRAPTPGRGGSSARGLPTRWPPRARSTPVWEPSVASGSLSTGPGPAHTLTLVHKTNVLTFAGDLWPARSARWRGVPRGDPRLQPRGRRLHLPGRAPRRYDVIVTDNLFGDILTDLAGAVSGGIGRRLGQLQPGPHRALPLRAGPRAAHDIAGQGIANPLAAITRLR